MPAFLTNFANQGIGMIIHFCCMGFTFIQSVDTPTTLTSCDCRHGKLTSFDMSILKNACAGDQLPYFKRDLKNPPSQ